MNRLQINELKRLHKAVIQGETAKAQRDKMLYDLNNEGVTQVELADICREAADGSMSNNAIQKIISRQKKDDQ